tara:strand:+ start:1283 stop:1861 length:579 start_codon:yes stop_codon:yes gene_type:complete
MKNFCFAFCIATVFFSNQAIGSEAGMPQLDPKFWASQIFWLIIIFLSLYLIVWKIFLPKITYSIENRKSKIVNDLDEAQKLKENAEKQLDEYNKIIEKTQKEAKKIIEDSRKKLERDIEEKKQKISEEIEKELLKAEKEIASLKKSSIDNIKIIASEISFEVVKQIVDIELNKSSVSAIVEDVTKKEVERYL